MEEFLAIYTSVHILASFIYRSRNYENSGVNGPIILLERL